MDNSYLSEFWKDIKCTLKLFIKFLINQKWEKYNEGELEVSDNSQDPLQGFTPWLRSKEVADVYDVLGQHGGEQGEGDQVDLYQPAGH